MRPTRSLHAILLTAAQWVVAVAHADEFDTVNVTAARVMRSDNNLFRLSDSANPNALLGKPFRSDVITTTQLGAKLGKSYSLQRFEFELTYLDYSYRNFGYLDFAATNYNGLWRWNLTPRLTGNLSIDRKQRLNSFADFRGFGTRNVNTVEFNRFDFAYEIDGAWRVIGAANDLTVSNEQAIVQEADYAQKSVEFGVRRDFRSGSLLSVTTKSGRGGFFKRTQPNAAALIDTGFAERQHDARLLWRFSGKSFVDARLGYLERKHDHFAQRDFSGFVGSAALTWGVTAKSMLKASVQRDFFNFQDTGSSYILSDRFIVSPTWELSPRVLLRANYDFAFRDYRGGGVVVVSPQRSDTLRTALVGIDWQPHRTVTLSAALQNDKRTSNFSGFDFVSTSALLAAQVGF